MKRSNLSLVAVLTVAYFGHCVTEDCGNCMSTSCSNIHTCYNCETAMESDCLQTYSGVDKDTCRTHLTTSSYIRASYVQSTQTCQLTETTCRIRHSTSIDVLFIKTCDTGCSNYTITRDDNQAVIGGSSNSFYGDISRSRCLLKCVPPSQDCTAAYVSVGDKGDCYVYTTNCGGSCTTAASPGWTVYKVTCNGVACPALSDPPNGVVDTSAGTSSGDQAIYTCNIGYVSIGLSVTTCGSDGNWDNSSPTCTPVDCGSLSNPADGTVTYSSTTYGSQANYDCNTGYSISSSSLRTCGSDGNWDNSAPTCSLVDCGSLSDPTDGTVSFSLTTYGSQANYDCNTGYSLSGSSVRTCGSDGNWDNSAPTCSLVDCGSLSDPTDGTVSFSLITYGSQANYNCNTGYSLSGSSVRTCGSDGNWNNSAPTCSLVDCGSLSNPTDGTVSFTLTTYGSQANYDCNTGYSLSGSSVRTCGSDGNWDNSAPTCSLVDCGSLSNSTDGTVSFTLTTYGSQASYNCNTGYSLSGSSVRTCGSDGNWDNSAPTCSLVDCGSLSDPIDGTVSFSLTTYGSQANYDCNIGYTLSGSSITTCSSDGNWDNSDPACTPVDCGSLTNPIFGSVTYTNTTYGAQANYTCNTGYSLTGSNSRSCLSNGTWELIEPECVSTDCGLLTDPVHGSVHTPAGTTFGKTATFSCDSGYALSHAAPRKCQATSKWSGASPTCILAGTTTTATTADPLPKKLYIMPCICYTNKTFVNMTQEEIIQQLIADTKIDTKETSLAQYKLKSRSDPRMSSKMIGMVAIVVLSVTGGLIIFCDILTIRDRIRQVWKAETHHKYKTNT